ncbi:tetratricopeptide repeat protein [Bacillus manliponensis]|uniref:response regulator aspartate phosphatase n=1 Tax=Bacillus manliponensis TaxID=574376 RepID=UPI003511A327
MFTPTKNETTTQLLHEWYREIRARRIDNARHLKEQADALIQGLKEEESEVTRDNNVLLYYTLLDFRFNYLINHLGVSKDSFDRVEQFNIPSDNFLSYYYHFFKAIHCDAIGNYSLAKEHYYKAEELLKFVPDELEQAEFYYKLGYSYYENQQGLLSIKEVTKAKNIFSKYEDHEINVAFCDNILGLACTYLREWELAEEHYTSAMDKFQKIGEEKFILMVRHNLGWMYATQNLNDLAIRYLTEVVEKSPQHYKAVYVKAKVHYKLEQHEIARELIERGLKISNELSLEEYQHRNEILKAMNDNSSAEELEKVVLAGIRYFDREELYDNVQEYYEILGAKCHEDDLYKKASEYFYSGMQAKKKAFEKGALK